MLELQFILTYDNTDYVVDEPDGFKSFNSVLERDFDTHGVFFRFTDSDLKLKFPGTGRDVLKAARDGFGIDATVDLTVKRRYRSTDSFVTIYTGTAIIENLELDEDFASCDFEEINDMIKIKDRLDVIVSTDATEDLDGGAISAATAITVNDTGKTILKKASGLLSKEDSDADPLLPPRVQVSGPSGGFTSNTMIFLEGSDEIEYNNGQGAFSSGVPTLNKTDDGLTKTEIGGRIDALVDPDLLPSGYTITITTSGIVRYEGVDLTGTVRIEIFEYDLDDDGVITNVTAYLITTIDLTLAGSNQIDIADTRSFTVTTNNKYFTLGFREDGTSIGGTGSGTISYSDILPDPLPTILAEIDTAKPATDISSFFIHEALRHNVHAVSGNDMLYAPFFGRTADGYSENGCAWNYTEANGYRVRAFSSRPNQMSLKDRLDSLKAIFGVGYGIERDAPEYDTYRFRVDTYDYWYNSELLYEFSDVVDYKEEYFDWFSFNEVEIGYKKYANDENEPGTTDDWNTRAGYLMPVGRLRGKKSFLSDYIASDYLIEYTRRKQFTKEPTVSWKYDDDLFIMDVKDSGGTWIPGSDFISGSSGNENPIVFNELISPRFNFFNQYLLVNSLAYKKLITDEYRNTFFRNANGTSIFYLNFPPHDRCLGDLTLGGTIASYRMDTNISLSRMRDANRLFDPLKISFKQALSTTQLDNIIEAHRNGAASANNGFFRVTNPDGETIEGWLLRLSFNYADQIGNFELIKKADAYSI